MNKKICISERAALAYRYYQSSVKRPVYCFSSKVSFIQQYRANFTWRRLRLPWFINIWHDGSSSSSVLSFSARIYFRILKSNHLLPQDMLLDGIWHFFHFEFEDTPVDYATSIWWLGSLKPCVPYLGSWTIHWLHIQHPLHFPEIRITVRLRFPVMHNALEWRS